MRMPERREAAVWIGLLLVPVLGAYWVLFHTLNRLPYQDDYAVLTFALRLRAMPTLAERLRWIVVSQSGDYKLILLHLVVAAQLALQHRIDLPALEIAGDLFLVPLGWLLWTTFSPELPLARRAQLFLPVVLVLFGLNYWESTNFVQPVLQYLPCLFFGLVSLHLLAGTGRTSLLVSMLAGVASSLSSGNGLLLAPIGLLFLLSRKRFKVALAWLGSFSLAAIAVFYRYRLPAHAASAPVWTTVLFYLTFLGSFLLRTPLAVAGGVALLAAALDAARTGFHRARPGIALAALWILITGLLVALARGGSGLDLAHSSRYLINSDLLVIFLWSYLLFRFPAFARGSLPRQPLYLAALAVSGLACLKADIGALRSLQIRKQLCEQGFRAFLQDPQRISPMNVGPEYGRSHPEQAEYQRATLLEALQTGLLLLPDRPEAHKAAEGVSPAYASSPRH